VETAALDYSYHDALSSHLGPILMPVGHTQTA
jgi:hypothetical protein